MKLYDQEWLEKLDEIIEQNISDYDFQVKDLAMAINTSPAQLNRRVNQLTGTSPKLYIRQKKLAEAKRILELGMYPTLGEVSAAVGYKHLSHFSTIFFEAFGERPIEYLRE